jgi:hypothetical protein
MEGNGTVGECTAPSVKAGRDVLFTHEVCLYWIV